MSNREIHYRYAISYLVLLLVASIGFGLYDIPSLVDKVSFALTVTSLVLGVVAIIYTFVSANKQDAQLAKLIETNHDISSASTRISDVAKELNDQVRIMAPRFDSFDSKLDRLTQSTLSAPSPEAQLQISNSPNSDPRQQKIELSLADLKRFLSELKYAGMFSLYLLSRAHRKDVSINEELVQRIGAVPFYYVLGVFDAAEASGFIKTTYKGGVISVISLSQVFVENINSQIESIIDIVEKSGRKNVIRNLVEAVDRELS